MLHLHLNKPKKKLIRILNPNQELSGSERRYDRGRSVLEIFASSERTEFRKTAKVESTSKARS